MTCGVVRSHNSGVNPWYFVGSGFPLQQPAQTKVARISIWLPGHHVSPGGAWKSLGVCEETNLLQITRAERGDGSLGEEREEVQALLKA